MRRFALLTVSLCLLVSSVAAQENRARRVEQQPAAAVRAPSAEAGAASAIKKIPFAPGERLTYDVSWNNNATAATVVLSVGERGKHFGKETLPLTADVQTVGLVRFLASVDLDYNSYNDPKTLLPHRADHRTTVNGRTDKGSIVFDRVKNVAVPEGGKPAPIGPETGDLLSLFYRTRALPLAKGDTAVLDGYDGKGQKQIKIVVEEREQIKTALGTKQAIRVAFMPFERGAPSDDLKIRVWYIDDATRIPALITAQPDFGAIRVALKSSANAKL